jgi:hypothetical protein
VAEGKFVSDPYLSIQRQIQALDDQLERLRKADTPPLYLPWVQRSLNPFLLASSGGVWGDSAVPWESYVLAFYCSVFVNTTNSATQYWTIAIFGAPSNNAVASVTTQNLAANTFLRLSDLTITQPASTDTEFYLTATATLSPGSIFIVPAVALLRAGN